MTELPTWLNVVAWVTVASMFLNGILFFTKTDLALKLTGHTREGAVSVVGARFFFFGVLGAVLLITGEYRAMAHLLAVGGFVALGDIFLEKRHGGDAAPHILVIIACAILAYFFYTLPMTGAS